MMVNSRKQEHRYTPGWKQMAELVEFVLILYVNSFLKHKFGSGPIYFVTVCKISCDQNIILHLLYIIWHHNILVGQIHSFVHSSGYGKLTWSLVLKYFRLQSARPDVIEKRWGHRPVWSALVVSPANAVNSWAVDPPSSILMMSREAYKLYPYTSLKPNTKKQSLISLPKASKVLVYLNT